MILFYVALFFLTSFSAAYALPYPITYVESPRSDSAYRMLPDVFHPVHVEPGTDIMLLPAGSSVPEVLVSGGVDGAAFDQVVSFDGARMAYVLCPNVRNRNPVRKNLPRGNCDLWEMVIATRQARQLTFGEWTPSVGGVADTTVLGHGVFNLGPTYLPGNRLMFTSSRQGYLPTKTFTDMNLQLYVLHLATGIQEQIAPMDLGSTLHPHVLTSGEVLHSRYESQGLRDNRLWGLWRILPDGRRWAPAWSAFFFDSALHFHTERSNGEECGTLYYNLNNNGFGTILCWDNAVRTPAFGPAQASLNIPLRQGYNGTTPRNVRWPFTPVGAYAPFPWAAEVDQPSAMINGARVGKLSHPRGAPNNALLLTYCVGHCNHRVSPLSTGETFYQTGIYLWEGAVPTTAPSDLLLVVDRPDANEWSPVPLVPYAEIYGQAQPFEHPWLPQGAHATLPKGTPYGLVGTSSLYNRSSAPGTPSLGTLEQFNTANTGFWNWNRQGSDAGLYANGEIHAMRLVVMSPTSRVGQGNPPYFTPFRERLAILGEFPIRKAPGILDPQGNPDTSFLAKIPADTPFTFQMLDARGQVLNTAQTWHQVRPGEVRTDCGGCHAHDKAPVAFTQTIAGQPGFVPVDLTSQPARVVEYLADVKPLLQRPGSCTGCHNTTQMAGRLNLSITTLDTNGFENAFNRLANDEEAQWGEPPPNRPTWLSFNASRYVRKAQSRRSLLMWRLYNARLDGQTNASALDDVDFASAVGCTADTLLTEEEKRTIAAWIDLGIPHGVQYALDELKPTITLEPGDIELRVGLADAHSGVDPLTLTILRDGANVTASFTAFPGALWLGPYAPGRWVVSVEDQAGNRQVRERVLP